MSFSRVGFVGYTATPFANIFVDPSTKSGGERFGPDLFPRSFIVNLKAPDNYIGPAVVFGHPGDESVGLSPREPLPMYVQVKDSATWIPSPHRNHHVPGPLPESLREAIRVFMLVCATRAARGDDRVHNSMLIHATRFVSVQSAIAEQVEQEVRTLQSLLSHGSETTRAELKATLFQLWKERLSDPHPSFQKTLNDRCLPLPEWEDVWSRLSPATDKIRVMRVNGTSDDCLAYVRTPEGLSVVAIGGDKLSRGLTLEGLSVSYFLRTSNMFDTLMQMGRWFGYRPSYADLCRVYTTADLYSSFREIALAIDDLRADLDRMAITGRTPEDFGLRVRTPSDGLLITAANKLRRGETVQVRFAGELVQALQIPSAGPAAQNNRDALNRLVESLPDPQRSIRGRDVAHFVWHDVGPEQIIEFMTSYDAYRTHGFLNHCEQLLRYVQDRVQSRELVSWTVCLVSRRREESSEVATIGALNVPLITRSPDKAREEGVPKDHHVMRALAGREEEAADLSALEYQQALEATQKAERDAGTTEDKLSRWPDRYDIRAARPSTRGLLLLYPIRNPAGPPEEYLVAAAVSFPESATATPLTYTVNDTWLNEYGFIEDWDDER